MSLIINGLYHITASSISRYLTLKNWQKDDFFPNKKLMVFYSPEYEEKIALPARESYKDFYIVLNEIINTLSVIEDKDINDIIKEILTVYSDRIEFRIKSAISEDGKLPLNYASQCIEGLKDLILYSACAEKTVQPVCARATEYAKKYLENFKLAQTEMGSFVINIETKVVDEKLKDEMLFEDLEPPFPMEHKIIERIATGMKQVNECIENKKKLSDITEDGYKTGITANMCEAFLKLKPDSADIEIDTTIRYASALTKLANNENHITINHLHFSAFNEISKIYRDTIEVKDEVIRGTIKSLSSKEQNTKYISLTTNYNGKERNINMELSEADNKLACDAYKYERSVEVSGELDMSNHVWTLNKIKYFKVL